jgi:hypothetical protein
MAKVYEIVFSDGAHFVVTSEEASILVDRLSQAISGDRNKKIDRVCSCYSGKLQ